MENRQLKVFVAGSKALVEQRNIFRAVLMKQQGLFNLRIETKTFEDFSDSLIEGGAQKVLYNQYIRNEADVIIFVLDKKIGNITKHEFKVAYQNFCTLHHPSIFVYCYKSQELQDKTVEEFKATLDSLNQYYTEYTSNQDLEHLFEKSINEYLINTYFKKQIRAPQEQIAFDLACQHFSNTLISCLATVDELSCLLQGFSNSCSQQNKWDKSLLNQEINHFLSEIERVSKIFPPENIAFTDEEITLLSSQVKDIAEISVLPEFYSTYFDDALSPIQMVQDYIRDEIPFTMTKQIIDAQISGFGNMANGFFYTLLGYLTQLPDEFQKNLEAMLLNWQCYPANVSTHLSPAEYERFSKREFDTYEKNLIRLQAILDAKDEELTFLESQFNNVNIPDPNSFTPAFCSNCGQPLSGEEHFCPKCGKKI